MSGPNSFPANTIWASPTSGSGGLVLRKLDTTDIPLLPYDPSGSSAAAQAASLPLAGTAVASSKLSAMRKITITGDGAWTVSFDGSGDVTSGFTMNNVNNTPGSYGSATVVPAFTVNAKGLVTATSGISISFPVTSVFGRTGAVVLLSSDITTALGAVPLTAKVFTVATLPAAASSKGMRYCVSDASVIGSLVLGGIVTGGSTSFAPVYCDGTNWRIG